MNNIDYLECILNCMYGMNVAMKKRLNVLEISCIIKGPFGGVKFDSL